MAVAANLVTAFSYHRLEALAAYQDGRLVARGLPIRPYDVVMIWNRGLGRHAALTWLRDQIEEISRRFRK